MKRRSIFFTIIMMLALVVLPACSSTLAQPQQQTATTVAPTATLAPAQQQPASSLSRDAIASLQGALEGIYADVNPSVVSIQVVQEQTVNVPVFPEVPGFPFFGPPTQQQPQQYYQHAAGSGFVWDNEGHIVTNNHVVAGADKIDVTFSDGTTARGMVVGTDPAADLAVVKVNVPADQLHPVQLADSTQVKVGQVAVAIGNPFGQENTMTVGFVSAVGRLLPVTSQDQQSGGGATYSIPDVIQTDAPINPGNSGGVLVDDQGHVIGVTSAIISPVQASAGIGFAIPSAIVQKVVPTLIETGHYDHPYIGISGTNLTPDITDAMNLKTDQRGALVVEIVPGSPADDAGLRGSDRQVTIDGQDVPVGGDVITAVDGTPVTSFDDVIAYLARSTEVGQTVTLTVLRDGSEQQIDVTLTARPTRETAQATDQQQAQQTAGGAWLGIVGLTITPDIAQAIGPESVPADQQGVLIERVVQGSPADDAGLRGSFKPAIVNGQRILVGGDVITAVDNEPITSMDELVAFIEQAKPDQQGTFTIVREGKETSVQVTLGERPETVTP